MFYCVLFYFIICFVFLYFKESVSAVCLGVFQSRLTRYIVHLKAYMLPFLCFAYLLNFSPPRSFLKVGVHATWTRRRRRRFDAVIDQQRAKLIIGVQTALVPVHIEPSIILSIPRLQYNKLATATVTHNALNQSINESCKSVFLGTLPTSMTAKGSNS